MLSGSHRRRWTVVGVAEDALVSDEGADLALRRFTAAGIIERLCEPGRRPSYRWRREMAYLHDGSEPCGRRDPVCGMAVPTDSPHVVEHEGHQVAFCSLPCLVRWRAQHRT